MNADDFRIGVFHGDEDIGPAFLDGNLWIPPACERSAERGFVALGPPPSMLGASTYRSAEIEARLKAQGFRSRIHAFDRPTGERPHM